MKTLVLPWALRLLVAFGLMVVLSAGAQNLIVNPYFAGTGGWSSFNVYTGVNPPPEYGSEAALLDTSSSSLTQSIPTVPGGRYHLLWDRRLVDLDASGIPIVGWSDPYPALLGVYANGQSIAQDLVQNRDAWAFDTTTFTATGTSTTLTFTDNVFNGIGGERSDDIFLDYVEMLAVPVPEPSVWAMTLVLFVVSAGWKAAKFVGREFGGKRFVASLVSGH
jgi:hypothetical protein